MSENEEQLEQIEISIIQAKENIAKADALDRLRNNDDFKLVMFDGYFEKEASRLVLLKADPSVQDDTSVRQVEKSIDAIGYVHQYFRTIYQIAGMSRRAVGEDETTREELIQEGAK